MQKKEQLIAQIMNLQNAIAEGALEVEFQGKKVKYRSLDEMRRIEFRLVQMLQGKQGGVFKKITSVFEKF